MKLVGGEAMRRAGQHYNCCHGTMTTTSLSSFTRDEKKSSSGQVMMRLRDTGGRVRKLLSRARELDLYKSFLLGEGRVRGLFVSLCMLCK